MKQEFNHLMVDIETLGTKPGCVVVSIAAVEFNLETGEHHDSFTSKIMVGSSERAGLKIDGNTVMWWLNQSKEAKVSLQGGNHIYEELLQFKLWIENKEKDYQVWGNSARFDLGILEAAYDAIEMPLPWNVYKERDVRTLVALAPKIKKETLFKGTKHYPLDDCLHQIEYCCKTYQSIMTNDTNPSSKE